MSSIRVLSESPPTLSTKQHNVMEIPKPKDQDACKSETAELALQ